MREGSDLSSGVMVNVNYEIPDELHRAVRILAAQRGTTIKALLIEALQNLVNQDEKERTQ